MEKDKYNLIFKGEIIAGAKIEDVKKKLAFLFKKDATSIELMFDGKSKIIKKNVDLDTCRKIAGTLKKAGAKCSAVKVKTDTKTSDSSNKETPSPPSAATNEKQKVTEEIIPKGKEKPAGSGAALKKTGVLLIILLTLITLGIYYPVWFLNRRDAINNLKSKKKLNPGIFVIGILLICASLILGFISGVSEEMGEEDRAIQLALIGNIVNLVAVIILLVKCFTVRRIFIEHFNDHLNRDINFSGVATFFFQIYYLQYKINRFE